MKLSDINKLFKSFFESHLLVNSYHYGVIEDFIALDNKEFSAVNVEYVSSNYTDTFINHQFSITIADLMSLDYPEMEHEIISNSVETVKDFIAFLKDSDITFSSGNITPFRQDSSEITAGIVMSLSLQFHAGYNSCEVPAIGNEC